MLHVLLHMAQTDAPMTSEAIAAMLETHPAAIRRTMGGLREAGYVIATKGHGGGWQLACDLSEVSLLDVYRALGDPELFALGLSNDSPKCLVEQSVNEALEASLRDAEKVVLDRFAAVPLSRIATTVARKAKSKR